MTKMFLPGIGLVHVAQKDACRPPRRKGRPPNREERRAMARHRKGHVRPLHDVFHYINMHSGDTSVCWEWLGHIGPRPIFCWNGTRLQARRVVYSLRNNLHYENSPNVTSTCGNHACCNPTHLIPEHGLIHKLVRNGGLDEDTLALIRADDERKRQDVRA
jgi:hypothetical protein